MRGVGDELLLLPPGRLHRADGPARQQNRQPDQRQQTPAADQQAAADEPLQRLLLAGDIGEDHAAVHAAEAQMIGRDLADVRLRRGSGRGDGAQKAAVGQVIVGRADRHEIAERVGPQHEIRQTHLPRLPGRDGLKGVGRDGLHHADRLRAQILPGHRIGHPEDHAQHHRGDQHDHKNDLDAKLPDHAPSTSR